MSTSTATGPLALESLVRDAVWLWDSIPVEQPTYEHTHTIPNGHGQRPGPLISDPKGY